MNNHFYTYDIDYKRKDFNKNYTKLSNNTANP